MRSKSHLPDIKKKYVITEPVFIAFYEAENETQLLASICSREDSIVIRSLFDSSLVTKQQHVYSKDASEGAADKKYE